MTATTVGDWERGSRFPREDLLGKLANVLGVEIASLIGHEMADVGAIAGFCLEIPLLGTVAAGNPEDHAHEDISIDVNSTGSIKLPVGMMTLRVVGDSMAPVALDGQYVMCDIKDPKPGDLVVCMLNGRSALFRRLSVVTRSGSWILEAVNITRGKTLEIDPRTDVLQCYRVIGVCFIAEGGE